MRYSATYNTLNDLSEITTWDKHKALSWGCRARLDLDACKASGKRCIKADYDGSPDEAMEKIQRGQSYQQVVKCSCVNCGDIRVKSDRNSMTKQNSTMFRM